MHGDSAWSLAVQLTREQVDEYLEKRRAQGFNAVMLNVVEHHFSSNPPKNAYGQAPFETAGDFGAPRSAYFDHVEYIVARAAEKGMLVLAAPAYMGFGGGSEGWYQDMVKSGAPELREYGRFVAQRLSAYDNLLWVQGGDYNPPEKDLLRAVANGIRDVDTRWPHTFHGQRGTAALDFATSSETWLSINNIYTTADDVVFNALRQYTRSTMPFFLIEAKYENEGVDDRGVRQQAWQAMLSGASGHLIGNDPMWYFGAGWENALDSKGARTVSYLRSTLESLPWWTLRPDADGELLTSGTGADASRAVAAITADRSRAVVYIPTSREITLDLSELAGPRVNLRWLDPTSGGYAFATDAPVARSANASLRTPGRNDDGDADWVLLVDSTD